ncbi:hypothetical protein ACP3T3_08855 [Chryseobacterium sp. CBSDS_008]|uniref:hypothetical protein n=1 Tax=Chryseobacterium sp. CBSDS_008 TaxID=3415265 RepID=UPI003CECB66E
MSDFSLLVRIKYDALDSEQKRMFDEEYKRRKKTFEDDYNSDLALEILRDISMKFPDESRDSSDKDVAKKNVNDLYITQKMQSGESYSFYIIVGIIILFSVSAFFLKPDRAKMQNAIVDKILLQKPQIFKTMKNFFLGEEMTEKYSQNFISNTLSKKGYSNLGIYEEDLVLVRKLDYRDEDSKENLITAYGFLGFTKVLFSDENLAEDNFSNKQYKSGKDHNTQRVDITRVESYKPSKGYNYYEEQSERREKNNVSQHSEAEINAPNQQGDSIQIN